MKKKLLLIALATTMVATMFTGCGSSKDEDTTPTTSVEQDSNSNVDDTTKEDATSKDDSSKEEVKGYDEVFYDEPNWAVEYEGKSEKYITEKKNEYYAMKWVFEDMTQKFNNKEEVVVTEKVYTLSIEGDEESNTFVCDIANGIPEDKKGVYLEFGGFDIDKTQGWDELKQKNHIAVQLNANPIEWNGGMGTPMLISVFVTINEDGTYSYKEINIKYML